MLTEQFIQRGYQIVQDQKLIQAAASFEYKGYQISFSTIGCHNDQRVTEVNIYHLDGPQAVFKDNLESVQAAIYFIDQVEYIASLSKDVRDALKAALKD